MPKLATIQPRTDQSHAVTYFRAPSSGMTGAYRTNTGRSKLHGSEFQFLLQRVGEFHKENGELPQAVTEAPYSEVISYDPVPPVRTYVANVTFVNAGRMPPMSFSFDPDDD